VQQREDEQRNCGERSVKETVPRQGATLPTACGVSGCDSTHMSLSFFRSPLPMSSWSEGPSPVSLSTFEGFFFVGAAFLVTAAAAGAAA